MSAGGTNNNMNIQIQQALFAGALDAKLKQQQALDSDDGSPRDGDSPRITQDVLKRHNTLHGGGPAPTPANSMMTESLRSGVESTTGGNSAGANAPPNSTATLSSRAADSLYTDTDGSDYSDEEFMLEETGGTSLSDALVGVLENSLPEMRKSDSRALYKGNGGLMANVEDANGNNKELSSSKSLSGSRDDMVAGNFDEPDRSEQIAMLEGSTMSFHSALESSSSSLLESSAKSNPGSGPAAPAANGS